MSSRIGFGGNPLIAFTDAAGMSEELMHGLAHEARSLETAFVFPPRDPANTRRVRIFAPASEVPFAGHPTLGIAATLVADGIIPVVAGRVRLTLEEDVGPVVVDVEAGPRSTFATLHLEQGPEMRPSVASAPALARILSLPIDAVVDFWQASYGVPYFFIRLKHSALVTEVRLNLAEWGRTLAKLWAPQIFVFAGSTEPGGTLRARMFAPALGIAEDPATGSACACLAWSLAERHHLVDGPLSWVVDQGVETGRPSRIQISATKIAAAIASVQVGGNIVAIGRGCVHDLFMASRPV